MEKERAIPTRGTQEEEGATRTRESQEGEKEKREKGRAKLTRELFGERRGEESPRGAGEPEKEKTGAMVRREPQGKDETRVISRGAIPTPALQEKEGAQPTQQFQGEKMGEADSNASKERMGDANPTASRDGGQGERDNLKERRRGRRPTR